jgi:glycosyltransferase involved in cell wall biosynthesis
VKILQILDERWDSGVTAYGIAVAHALAARGHAVTVAARPGKAAAQRAAGRGLPVLPLGAFLASARAVRAAGFDVVNAHTGAGHTLGFAATRLTRTALVRTRGEARRSTVRPGQAALFRRTDAVVAASRALAEAYARRFPFLGERLKVVEPAVELPLSPPPPPEAPFRVGMVGRLDPVKGHRFFIEAVAQLKGRLSDQEFWIAGEDKNTTRADLAAWVAAAGVDRWVRLFGQVPDVAAFMAQCHVGVVASVDSEAVCRAGLEWMAQGRPLVASSVGALPEIVLNGDNGFLVPPKSAGGLARTLGLLMDDPARCRRMGDRARRVAEERFAPGRLGAETEAIYENARARRRAS